VSIWLTALKAVPWTDVIAAAPAVVRGARKLFKRPAGESMANIASAYGGGEPSLQSLSGAVEQLSAQQRASEAAIETLSLKNSQLMEAVGILRARCQLLIWFSSGLLLLWMVLVAWLFWQARA
jgi:hypothetical protein